MWMRKQNMVIRTLRMRLRNIMDIKQMLEQMQRLRL